MVLRNLSSSAPGPSPINIISAFLLPTPNTIFFLLLHSLHFLQLIIDFSNYIESIENAITGPVIIQFPSYEEKIKGTCKNMRIIQQGLIKCEKEKTIEFGGGVVASCYLLGSHVNINESY